MSTEDASGLLESSTFASSVYITEYNQPVCLYAQVRAQMFARHHKRQLFWVQAEDIPPAMHFAEYSSNELQDLKKKWLLPTYHARKTQGIPSLLPCAQNMPYRLMSSANRQLKDHGITKGALIRLKAWDLHEEDLEVMKTCVDDETVLKHMPTTLFFELIEGTLKADWPDLPPNWFPLKAEHCTWSLDATSNIHITRRGFAFVPDFSTTIHSATGRTLASSIVDLEDFSAKPNPSATMKAYIALSRLVSDLMATI